MTAIALVRAAEQTKFAAAASGLGVDGEARRPRRPTSRRHKVYGPSGNAPLSRGHAISALLRRERDGADRRGAVRSRAPSRSPWSGPSRHGWRTGRDRSPARRSSGRGSRPPPGCRTSACDWRRRASRAVSFCAAGGHRAEEAGAVLGRDRRPVDGDRQGRRGGARRAPRRRCSAASTARIWNWPMWLAGQNAVKEPSEPTVPCAVGAQAQFVCVSEALDLDDLAGIRGGYGSAEPHSAAEHRRRVGRDRDPVAARAHRLRRPVAPAAAAVVDRRDRGAVPCRCRRTPCGGAPARARRNRRMRSAGISERSGHEEHADDDMGVGATTHDLPVRSLRFGPTG